jgi:hypothetical protein
MTDIYSRIVTMRDMFLYSNQLYSWQLDPEFNLQYSNSPNHSFLFNIFSVGYCYDATRTHFSDSEMPIILSDKLGIGWLIAAQIEQHLIVSYHMLGPFYTIDPSDNYVNQICSKMTISTELFADFFKQLKEIPTIPLNIISHYGIMLYYCTTGNQCKISDIKLNMEEIKQLPYETDWHDINWHGTWESEQKFFHQLEEGTITDLHYALTEFSSGQVGVMVNHDPLRQSKNEGLVCTALACRAVIRGGVSPEGAYNLSDYYSQKIEKCKHVSDVQTLTYEMLNAFLQRSIQTKDHKRYSILVSTVLEYVETHIYEKISLELLAKEVGYSAYYLTNRFQKEMHISLNQYIQQRKIGYAKEMLKNTRHDIADISEKLSFSSPSYFAAVFRKHTGLSPGEFITAVTDNGVNTN